MSDGLAARRSALAMVEAVLEHDRGLDECADATAGLEPRDRAFARLIALTVLRRLGQLDALTDLLLEKPPQGRTRRIRHVLRIGLAQLLFLETPAHAAVDASVELARGEGMAKLAGLVNAVLRRAVREKAALLSREDAVRANTPAWLRDDWVGQFGEETTQAIADAHLAEPPTDLTCPDRADDLAAELGGTRIGRDTVRLVRPGDVAALPGYDAGTWWVQDVAATLPATLLGDVAGRRVIDLCAAPGGKTAQLAAASATVSAVDRSKPRLARLRENMERLGLTVDIVAADATQWRPDEPADAVLLDAPCSATGTLRRHPEIAHRRGPADVQKLAALQRRLANAAIEMLKPGGILVAATCSLQSAEGPGFFNDVRALEGLEPLPIDRSDLPTELGDAVTPDGCLRTHPAMLRDQGGMDGFFVMRFRKRP